MESKHSLPCSWMPTTCSILSHMNPIHGPQSYFFGVHFNIILPPMDWSSMMSLSFKYSNQSPENISLLPHSRNLCWIAICKSDVQSLWWSYQCCQVATNFVRIQAFCYARLCHWTSSSWYSKYHPPFTDKHSKQDSTLAAWCWRYKQHSFEITVNTRPVTQHSILEIFNIWQFHR